MLVYLIIKGILRGFIREVSSLVGIILGGIVGITYMSQVSEFLEQYVPNATTYLPLVSLALIFAGFIILCNLIGWALHLFFKKAFLGWFDRLLGATFAVIKVVFITYGSLVILTFYINANTPLIANSLLAPWVIKSYQAITGLVSPDHYRNLKKRVLGEQKKISDMVTKKIDDLSK
jgi:membrane protein required for colicin V production